MTRSAENDAPTHDRESWDNQSTEDAYPAEKDAWREPPEGWHTFGTHVDVPVRLEFSDETDDGGMPLWERPIPPEVGQS